VDERDSLKRAAAEHATSFLTSGMVVGLGTGTTAIWATRKVGALLAAGELRDIVAIPTSSETDAEARRLGVPITTFVHHPVIDLTIDGADEIDPELDLIKGGGGALLHEKVVAQASRREIIVVDEAKLSPTLGTQVALPVEVVPFGQGSAERFLRSLGGQPVVRVGADGQPLITDEGNVILDCAFGALTDKHGLAAALDARADIAAHGLFLGLATDMVVASESGVRHVTRPS